MTDLPQSLFKKWECIWKNIQCTQPGRPEHDSILSKVTDNKLPLFYYTEKDMYHTSITNLLLHKPKTFCWERNFCISRQEIVLKSQQQGVDFEKTRSNMIDFL